MFCLLVVLVNLSVLAKGLAGKTPPRKPNRGEEIVSAIKVTLSQTDYYRGTVQPPKWQLIGTGCSTTAPPLMSSSAKFSVKYAGASRDLLLYVARLLSVCHCLFSDYARQYLLKMGGQLDKRMLHWQPATCCIFSCSLLSVIWRIKYYYYLSCVLCKRKKVTIRAAVSY